MASRKSWFFTLFAAAFLPLTLSCASSYRHTERASTQIKFGKKIAKRAYWREAMFRFEQAIAKDPKNAFAHNDFAVALEANGEYARALEEYKRAAQLAPKNKNIGENYKRFAEFYAKNEGKVEHAK